MYIGKEADYIENQVHICYYYFMNTDYDYKMTAGRFHLQLSNTLTIAEREIHSYHEILYCPNVQTVLHTERRQLTLSGKNLLIIPKGQYHLFDLSAADRFPRLKIAVPDAVTGEIPGCSLFLDIHGYNVINLPTELLIRQISETLSKGQTDMQAFYLSCAVWMLLAELNSMPPAKLKCSQSNNVLLVQLTDYITQNLSGDLSIKALAKIINASPSYLTHRFQKEVGIPLHRYITQKRMIYARELIDSGEKPTKIYLDCGYKDYSSFYKAYCDFFSAPPSERLDE